MATVGEVFIGLTEELKNLYGVDEAGSIIRLLFREKLGISRLDLAIKKEKPINAEDLKNLKEATERLLKGEPIQYITGKVDFANCIFKVNKDALIPRPETEELVQAIIKENKNKGELYVLDIGTGSGCIAISLAKNLPESAVTGIDISQRALELAQINAISNKATVDFQNLDILDEDSWKKMGEFDIIVSNPPYIRESEKEKMHINVLDLQSRAFLGTACRLRKKQAEPRATSPRTGFFASPRVATPS